MLLVSGCLVKSEDALLRRPLRSSLSVSVLLGNLLSSQLLAAGRKHGAYLTSIRDLQAPPKSLAGLKPREQHWVCTDTKALSIFFLAESFGLSSETSLSSLKASAPFLEAVFCGIQRGKEREPEGGSGPPGGLESEGLCPRPQFPHP